jgi:hypothetical protein
MQFFIGEDYNTIVRASQTWNRKVYVVLEQ